MLSIVLDTEKALNKYKWEISWFTRESIPGPHLLLQVEKSADGVRDTMFSTSYQLSAALRTELQLRGGGNAEGCAPGCQAELPLPTKLHYLGLAPWLPHWSQGPGGTQGHGSQLLAA